MPDVIMPPLSDLMSEGTVLKWLKASGEPVERGEELVEIETDKATVVYEAEHAGRLDIVVAEGETVPVGAPIARIHNGDRLQNETQRGIDGERFVSATPARIKASPLARRIAAHRGLDLSQISGTGPGGRILRIDVEPDRWETPEAAIPPAAPAIGSNVSDVRRVPNEIDVEDPLRDVTRERLTQTQQLIAQRMTASKSSTPEFTVEREIDMEACAELRAQLSELTEDDTVPSYNEMIIKACAIALRDFPRANGSYRGDHFVHYARINVGFAVASEAALIVPTIFDADRKRLSEIAAEVGELAERARAGKNKPKELSGATFTVSNLGMFRIDRFSAVINPPQAAILATGSIAPRPACRAGQLVIRRTMNATLSCDHRILYGVDAARLIARIAELLERPLALWA